MTVPRGTLYTVVHVCAKKGLTHYVCFSVGGTLTLWERTAPSLNDVDCDEKEVTLHLA